jgi:hypothetical protein
MSPGREVAVDFLDVVITCTRHTSYLHQHSPKLFLVHTSHIVLTTIPSVSQSFLLFDCLSDVNAGFSRSALAPATEAMDRAALAAAASGRRVADGEPDDVLDLLRRLRLRVGGRGADARGGRVRSVARAYERLLTHVRPAPSVRSMDRHAPTYSLGVCVIITCCRRT